MSGRLSRELKQTKPFESLEAEVLLNLLKTADWIGYQQHQVFKPAGLSAPQYNILRILRGSGEEGRSCQEIAERMITHDPDVTRLLDRLEDRGWARRERNKDDRRVVRAWITADGLKVLNDLDEPLRSLLGRLLGHMSKSDLTRLNDLLEAARPEEKE